jgi:hypothetical protein
LRGGGVVGLQRGGQPGPAGGALAGEIEPQALLLTRVSRLDDGPLRAALLTNLRDSMLTSRLGVSELAVFAPDGQRLLHEGVEHGPGPEGERALGFG